MSYGHGNVILLETGHISAHNPGTVNAIGIVGVTASRVIPRTRHNTFVELVTSNAASGEH